MVAELDAAFADARAKNPQLGGRTAICVEVFGGQYAVLGASAPRSQFLADVGMTLEPTLAALAGKGYNAPLSPEKLDLLDEVDVVVWTTDVDAEKKLLADPLVKVLRSTQEARYVARRERRQRRPPLLHGLGERAEQPLGPRPGAAAARPGRRRRPGHGPERLTRRRRPSAGGEEVVGRQRDDGVVGGQVHRRERDVERGGRSRAGRVPSGGRSRGRCPRRDG